MESSFKDRAAHYISPTRLSAVVFDGKSHMHILYCIYHTDRREADPSAREPEHHIYVPLKVHSKKY